MLCTAKYEGSLWAVIRDSKIQDVSSNELLLYRHYLVSASTQLATITTPIRSARPTLSEPIPAGSSFLSFDSTPMENSTESFMAGIRTENHKRITCLEPYCLRLFKRDVTIGPLQRK
jgi:hypothetical protein